jgi:hypothetical protein
MTVTELRTLADLPPQNPNFTWQVLDSEPLPEDDPAPGDGSDRARWLHELYTLLQRHGSITQAQAWQILQDIQDLPGPPLPETSRLPDSAVPDPYELAEAELMARNKVTRTQAGRRLDEAHHITGLPRILDLVRTGRLDEHRARYIAWKIARLLPTTGDPAADRARVWHVEDAIADRAPDRTTRQLAHDIRTAVIEIDPDAFRAEHEREKTRTHVRCWHDHAGMGIIEARLDDRAAATIDQALTLLADAARNAAHRAGQPLDDVGATHGQRRANALTAIFTAILDGTPLPTTQNDDGQAIPAWWQPPALPTRKRRRPHLVLTVDARTLLGLDDLAADLAGYGAISPDLARTIAKECGSADVIRTDAYQATAAIHSRIGAVHRTCRFPGCDVPAHDCDTDHLDPFADGGDTSTDNLIPLCRRHHRIKTHTPWQPALHPDGSIEWTSPTGQRFTGPPEHIHVAP